MPEVEMAIQASVRRWVRTVMQQQGWSAEEWARRAATTPTNITRILSSESSLPNADTLGRLARVAGSQPDLVGSAKRVANDSVPLLDHDQVLQLAKLTGKERRAFLDRLRGELVTMQGLFRPSTTGFGVAVETDALRGRGVLKGDIMVIEPADFSGEDGGSIVAAIVGRQIGPWLWYPPVLVPAHENTDTVPMTKATILGRVVQLMRQL
jgi:hypothetical protein